MMSKEKHGYTNFKVKTRPSYPELGISKERLSELQNGCRVGIYSSEMLSKACAGVEFIKPWIILSVTKSMSYDALKIKWQLKEIEQMPCCRSDFYGFRRKFYHNLDYLLKTEQDNVSAKERGKG